ncbi:cytochrome p450 [Nannochloropsis gaditana CCMP526]|uniref:cytochrome p450 n=1 Tax=Nannochloropsis gaditana (strain CCMP526) TaxID=1093141 RepID=UPI00029F7A64|nr:cytochrome p450 [Nannochloropsis gaditana CCMP526]EKU22991.1 cytochrome p450 [Nannochloropsis gaditana CCMP526]|eukprot:XP_005853369.1 cytochrome p450 [Nannochloropsis gaditana CCMP526]
MRFLTLEAVSQASFSLPLGLLGRDRGESLEYSPVAHMSTPSSSYPSLSTKGLSFTGRRVDRLVRDNFRLLGESIRFPLPGAHRIGWNKPYNRLQKVNAELLGIENAIIEGRRLERERIRSEGGALTASRDLLDVYLEAIENEDLPLSNESIFRNLNDIFMAGSDTTATTISASLYEIVRRPDVKARVLAELESLDLSDPQAMSPSQLAQRLPFLDMCIKETLRLFPVAVNLSRVAARDTVLGGFHIPKGATVAPCIRLLHLDTATWGPDAAEFRPERWASENLEGGLPKGVPQGAYLPFGAGPRVCLGLRFALLEAMTVSVTLLKKLDLEVVDPNRDLDVYYPAAMSFRDGVQLRIGGLR